MLKRLMCILAGIFFIPALASAQTFTYVGPSSTISVDVSGTLPAASALTWTALVDALPVRSLVPVTCTLIAPAPLPPLPLVRCATALSQLPTDGISHTVTITAATASGVTGTAPALSYLTATLILTNVKAQ